MHGFCGCSVVLGFRFCSGSDDSRGRGEDTRERICKRNQSTDRKQEMFLRKLFEKMKKTEKEVQLSLCPKLITLMLFCCSSW